MEGNGSAENIVKRITALWEKDDLQLSRTCWLATDNASTFKGMYLIVLFPNNFLLSGVHDGVAAKLKKYHHMPCLELNTCVAHSYALVGKQSGQYLDSDLTETENSFGAFKILSKANRDDLKKECCFHVERLLEEIERRFLPSELHRCLSFLFDPMMIEENRPLLNDATYGRHELQYLRQKYEKLSDFDSKNVQMEWESFKPLIVNFIEIKSNNDSPMRHCT
ncbi:unnamed protein product [Rotaria sp. Silwood2]|nr:unnamed protein product [Rotaria sp. Silwood2]